MNTQKVEHYLLVFGGISLIVTGIYVGNWIGLIPLIIGIVLIVQGAYLIIWNYEPSEEEKWWLNLILSNLTEDPSPAIGIETVIYNKYFAMKSPPYQYSENQFFDKMHAIFILASRKGWIIFDEISQDSYVISRTPSGYTAYELRYYSVK